MNDRFEREYAMKVMIIDDDDAVGKTLKKVLRFAGHDCEIFQSPVEGVASYKSGDFDVVLSDIRMPEMDGIKVLAKIREYDPSAYVIMLTGFADLENAIKANNYGSYAFFRKPFEIKKILETLSRIEGKLRQVDENEGALVRLCLEYRELAGSLNSKYKFR
jgi:DNA-binding NtrC family response regulator